jgi:hypothetical protein
MVNAPAALLPVKNLRYQLKRWPAESKSRSGRFGEEKNLLPMPRGKVFNRITGYKGTVNEG